MENLQNYQKKLDGIIEQNQARGIVPRLLLHSCCAACSSYCLEYLSKYFSITVLYYNPNIYPESEFTRRAEEQKRIVGLIKAENPISLVTDRFDPQEFYNAVRGFENEREGHERCFLCYELRMRRAAELAAQGGFDYFTTTLTVSPLKNARKINEIGRRLEDRYAVRHLDSDFKKKNGFKRSVELSKQLGIYRQNYCGCVFSLRSGENAP